ncbi:hypothetical protein BH23ACT2_BH23ACT2_27210 [soil metagenome]
MTWFFALLGLVLIVVIGLVLVGRETSRLAVAARPAVFDLAQAVDYIADSVPEETQARISHDDVRWVLLADADLLEAATADPTDGPYPWSRSGRPRDGLLIDVERLRPDAEDLVVDETSAVARILAAAERTGRELADEDVVAVLDARMDYLEAIGAVGGQADVIDEGSAATPSDGPPSDEPPPVGLDR